MPMTMTLPSGSSYDCRAQERRGGEGARGEGRERESSRGKKIRQVEGGEREVRGRGYKRGQGER